VLPAITVAVRVIAVPEAAVVTALPLAVAVKAVVVAVLAQADGTAAFKTNTAASEPRATFPVRS
jgi:hypothetical protein